MNYWTDVCETPQEQWITEWMGGRHSADLIKIPQAQWITEWMCVRHHRSSELLNGWAIDTVQDDWDTTGAVNYWMDGYEKPQGDKDTTEAVNYWMDGCETPQKQWITEWMGVRHHRMIKTSQEQWITEWMCGRHSTGLRQHVLALHDSVRYWHYL